MSRVKSFIYEFLKEINIEKKTTIGQIDDEAFWNINFLENEVLDSIEIVTLIASLEENFNFSFDQNDIESDEFKSFNGISRIVEKKIGSH